MSAYVTQADIQAQISLPDLIAALNDDNSGTLNETALNNVINAASARIDSALASVYELPFNPVPQPVFDACLAISCYMIVRRTKAGKENNPFQSDYDNAMKWLQTQAASEKVGLDQTTTRAIPPVFINQECLSTYGTTA